MHTIADGEVGRAGAVNVERRAVRPRFVTEDNHFCRCRHARCGFVFVGIGTGGHELYAERARGGALMGDDVDI
ncbi:Uncharacterised protein [Mycobacteroides abscessus]|nr:Uncharacterised protein [Mycobacteroides abscessus]